MTQEDSQTDTEKVLLAPFDLGTSESTPRAKTAETFLELLGVLPTVVSPGAIWAQVEPGLESEALLANSVKHGWSESTELLITVKNWDSRD